MIIFVPTLYGQTCDCRFCFDRVTVNANTEYRIYNLQACPSGKAAAVSSINVESTDGSGFQIYTKNDPSELTYYTAGSTTTTVTCFKMGQGFLVGGQKSRIYVIIQCKNPLKPCSIRYSIDLTCTNVATTSTTPTVTINNTCECHCCKGNAGCVPVHVGTILYGRNTCQPSDCASRCSKQFSACPADANQPGKIQAYCRNNASIMTKNIFYILFFTLFIHIYI